MNMCIMYSVQCTQLKCAPSATIWNLLRSTRRSKLTNKRKKIWLCDRKESEIYHDLYLHIHMIWNETNVPWHNTALIQKLYTISIHIYTELMNRSKKAMKR